MTELGAWPFRLGLAILVGAAAVTSALLLLSIVSVPWPVLTPIGAALLIVVTAAWVAWTRSPAPEVAEARDRRAQLIDVVTLGAVTLHLVASTAAAPYEWDYFGVWGLKARTFVAAQGVDWQFLSSSVSAPDRPLFWPLLLDLPAVISGAWDDRWLGAFGTALAAGAILVVRGVLGAEMNAVSRSLSTLAVAGGLLNPWTGLAEGAVAAYAVAGIALLRRASSPSMIRAGALLLGVAAFTKNEGSLILVVAGAALALTNRRALRHCWPALPLPLVWFALRAVHGLRTDHLDAAAFPVAGAKAVLKALILYAPAPLVLITCAIALVWCYRNLWRERFVLLCVGGITAALSAAYLFLPDPVTYIAFSWPRVGEEVLPLVLLLATLLLARSAGGMQGPPASLTAVDERPGAGSAPS